MNKEYRLPETEGVTQDALVYVVAWKERIKYLLKATTWTLYAFNPGYQLVAGSVLLTLTVSQATVLNELAKKALKLYEVQRELEQPYTAAYDLVGTLKAIVEAK